jgi:hypothetical protein
MSSSKEWLPAFLEREAKRAGTSAEYYKQMFIDQPDGSLQRMLAMGLSTRQKELANQLQVFAESTSEDDWMSGYDLLLNG